MNNNVYETLIWEHASNAVGGSFRVVITWKRIKGESGSGKRRRTMREEEEGGGRKRREEEDKG